MRNLLSCLKHQYMFSFRYDLDKLGTLIQLNQCHYHLYYITKLNHYRISLP